VIGITVMTVALLLNSVQKVRTPARRTQATNCLKNIGLAFHGFHDAHKRLPFNGTVAAVANDHQTGSWAFQILPYIDQPPMFASKDITQGVHAYMCSARQRPTVSTTGAWTDFFINPWVNDPVGGAVHAPDRKCTQRDIEDGEANTIFVGHGTIDPRLYSSKIAIAQSTDIFKGGDPATARSTTTNIQDARRDGTLNWGSPYPQGALMCMGDATVRMFPYTTHSGGIIRGGVSTKTTPGLGVYLTPAGGENVELPDV
jgi:hypothetical protein